jgi:transposase InsO family protein
VSPMCPYVCYLCDLSAHYAQCIDRGHSIHSVRGHSKHFTIGILNKVGAFKMPWKEETLMSLKEDFVEQALSRQAPFTELCRRFNITRKTGYRLLKRYSEEGLPGLEPKSKKPLSSPAKTPFEVEKAIVDLRYKQPTWGAKKILKILSLKNMDTLPSVSTVNEILKRNGLITIEDSLKRQKLIRFERDYPNDLWQMDFKGHFQLLTKQTCYPLTILDDNSRYSLCIKACQNEQHLTVKKRLTHVFKVYGLPKQINVDNGNPWGNARLLPYTAFTVWLMQLGIRVSHSRPRHPQTNGKLERFHRTLKQDVILRKPLRSFYHAQKTFDSWRHEYNNARPHEAIEMEFPSQRYLSSTRQMPNKLPAIEYHSGATLRKVRGNGFISYSGKEYLVGEAFKNYHIEVKYDEINQCVDLYFGGFKIHNYTY